LVGLPLDEEHREDGPLALGQRVERFLDDAGPFFGEDTVKRRIGGRRGRDLLRVDLLPPDRADADGPDEDAEPRLERALPAERAEHARAVGEEHFEDAGTDLLDFRFVGWPAEGPEREAGQ